MRICIIIPSFYPAVVYGGWVFSSLNTCRELAKLGLNSYVSTTNDNGKEYLPSNYNDYIEIEDKIFVKYYPQTVKEKFSLKMLMKLWKDIYVSDIIHIQGIFSLPTPLGLFYASLLRKKILLSPHGCLGNWCLSDGSKFKKLYLNFLIKPFANNIWWHATALQEKNEILALFPKAKIDIISNGVNMDEFTIINKLSKTEFVKKYTNKVLPVKHVLISMSRLHKKKGLDILLKSFHILLKNKPETILLIAGDDFGEKEILLKIVEDLKLTESVYFIGHIKDQERIDFFANGDVFVLPSHNENFGLVYAEAMAAGTPVVASQNTPWEELEQYKIGKWVLNQPITTAKAVEEILEKNYNLMGLESKKFIEDQYSWSSVGKKFKKVFEKIAKA